MPVANDEIVGYSFKGANKRMSGSKMYYSYEVHLVGDSRNTIKDWESTSITPMMLNIKFSNVKQYNGFVKEVNKALKN